MIRNYPDRLRSGFAGQAADSGTHTDVISLRNIATRTAQVSRLAVSTATNGATYSWTLLGIALSIVAASGTGSVIATAIAAAINDDPVTGAQLIASASSTNVDITARNAGMSFTLSTSDAKLTATTQTANASDATIPYGRAVAGGGDGKCSLMSASLFEARAFTFTPTVGNNTAYEMIIVHKGLVYRVSITSDGSATAQEVVEAVVTRVNAAMPANTVIATEDNSVVVLTAENEGETIYATAPADVGTWETDGDTVENLFRGVALIDATLPNDDGGYAAGKVVGVMRAGRVYVSPEDTPTVSSDVYVRVAANGTLDKLGGFRATADSGCVALPRTMARWVEVTADGLAVLQVAA